MNIYALLSFIAFLLFLQAGVLVLFKNFHEPLNRQFALLSFLFAYYAFFYYMFFQAETVEAVYLYDRIASLGWVFFPLVSVWFFRTLTQIRNRVIDGILYFFLIPVSLIALGVVWVDLESVKYFYLDYQNWYYIPNENSPWYYMFVLYLMVTVLCVLYMLFYWLYHTESNRQRIQARIMLFALSLFFVASVFTNLLLPFFKNTVLPAMAPINAIIYIGGGLFVILQLPQNIHIAQIKYKILIHHFREFLFLFDTHGHIYESNRYTRDTLMYNNYDLSRLSFEKLFSNASQIRDILDRSNAQPQMTLFYGNVIDAKGKAIPVEFSLVKIVGPLSSVIGFALVGADYRQKLKLKEEIAERVKTEKNLFQVRMELEMLVKKRTQELHEANMRLQNEVYERRRAEQQIKTDLDEKVNLVKEVHHRVKNNIQMIISLVNMLGHHPDIDSLAAEKLREIAEKVRYISRIHEDFYASPNLSRIAIAKYLKKTAGVLYSNHGGHRNVVFKLNIAEEFLEIEYAIPLGIIFNELLLNALKHAFAHERFEQDKCIVSIEFYRRNDHFVLVVSDNGEDQPVANPVNHSDAIGLQLVDILVRDHLNGELKSQRTYGTTHILKFQVA